MVLEIGSVRGIVWQLHFTLLFLLGWELLPRVLNEGRGISWQETLLEIAFALSVLVLLLLHELGHVLAAAWCGIATREVTLLPVGGVARLERLPDRLRQELVIALAGPAVNVILAGVFLAWEAALGEGDWLRRLIRGEGGLALRLFQVNLALVLLNLLPALPLDGGRVLRAVLTGRRGSVHATRSAAAVGQGMALVIGFVGLLVSPLLVFVALSIWIGAAQEAAVVQAQSTLAGIPVSQVMTRDFRTLRVDDSLAGATKHVLAGFRHDFPVEEEGRLVGVLTRGDLLTALARHGEEGRVGDVMRRDFHTAAPGELLEQLVQRLQECGCKTLPVLDRGRLVGLVSMDALGEFLVLHSAAGS